MQDLPSDRDALKALLDFHVEAGVDLALDETPHNRFAEPKAEPARAGGPAQQAQPARAPASPASSPSPRALPKVAASAPDEVASMAREQARHAQSLQELEAILAGFEGCALKFSAKNLAFADGNPEGRVMLIGEAPGADEDRIGKPFMGRSGQLLDRMLATIGLDRSQVYVANIVPWRPPGNRTPTPQEIAICKPFIARQIELAKPEFMLCLGGPAAQNLLGLKEGILRTRGRWFSYKTEDGREIRALPTLHPAYLLRQPLQKRLGWRDFMALRRALDAKE
ncbi:uracil-DNA glycosylase [Microvirga guangxiensis]|uniref:Type-4 uracil-DNA glycosylase n=1 Tax=Microvirga guangxiensis TaxID=549386 RepID=A0A1G5JP26_9HYPH|nr:uracil-DNA glycosylase [Microvirga guangxiensis]SCY89610.1 DNA polymerase [Microvirga guangxiensis]